MVAPTHRREPAHRAVPKRIEDWDIARIQRDYADAAERMQAAGLDGIELEAYGHLMDQFWSPLTNDLADGYGGPLENRMRFSLEVLSAIRARVGPDFIVGVRMVADEATPGGLGPEDGRAIARRLEASGMVDFLNIIRGRIDTDAALTDVIPIQGMPSAPHLDFAGELRAETRLPTSTPPHPGRADRAPRGPVRQGRHGRHDPGPHDGPRHRAQDRGGGEDEIRPCVGANYCLDRIYQGGAAHCIHNAATGREETMPHAIAPAPVRRKVVVVGAGPAGLEAARVAGERGHAVVVFEAASDPGGQVRLTAQSPRRREMIGIVDWRVARCAALGVRFRFNTLAETSDVLAEDPDVVIVATGGLPHTGVLERGNDLVVSAWDIIAGDVKPGANVLVFDEAGDHAGLQAAEIVAATGAKVEIMTPDRTFAPEVMAMNLVPYMRALQSATSPSR